MSKALNLCQFIGNLGKDPEVKYTQSGTAVASFSLATSHSYKSNDEWKEKTEWINITCWDRLAEIAGKYLRKGSKVYISGRMETQSWEKDGHKNYKTVIVAQNLIMLDGKQDSDQDEDSDRGSRSESRGRSRHEEPSRRGGAVTEDDPITDLDVPF